MGRPVTQFVRYLPALLHRVAAILLFALATRIPDCVAAPIPSVDYAKEIKPILRDRCYTCHGRVKQKAQLRLDAGALIAKGGKHGAVVTPTQANESPLLQRIRAKDDSERMPPEGKPLAEDQIALIDRWISEGATFPPDEPISKSPQEHWAFQPIRLPPLPPVKATNWLRNPIDQFILARLEQQGWHPTRPATSQALLRRVHLDLTGIPPTLAEQGAFGADNKADALDQVIDDLLARPSYGERWARHWLDVVRYADSNGYERDAEKPYVWRYRDYVIASFNSDKPFDIFATEQLAGDELDNSTAESMIATSYLRLGHWDDEPADPPTDRYDQLDDIVSTTAQAFLGLTLGCARCHDHKFEPLSTRDYYQMVAIFDPLQRPRDGRTELTLPVGSKAELSALAQRDRSIAELKKKSLDPAELTNRIQAAKAAQPDLPRAYIWEEPHRAAPETHVLIRGSPTRPGERVNPGIPSIIVTEQPEFRACAKSSGRRLSLAHWLTSAENTLTARVIVNRVWQHHFGQGLVRTPNDFGLMGEAPTHPELLDWLSDWFVHDAHWSLKRLHRLILSSNTWRESTELNPTYSASDPENRFYWRFTPCRLDAEAIRDSIVSVSGQLNSKMYGPAMRPPIQKAVIEANTDKESSWPISSAAEASRRSIYAFIKRGLVIPLLDVLDLADTVSSCPRRQVTTVAPQALSLFNGDFVNDQAKHFAARLLREAGLAADAQLELAWRLALSRSPSFEEKAALLEFLDSNPVKTSAVRENSNVPDRISNEERLTQVCRVILNLNEFVYPE